MGGLFGGGDVEVPPPSQEEKDLQKSQSELLNLQSRLLEEQNVTQQEILRQQNLLQPVILENQGIKSIRDSTGRIVGFENVEDPLRQEIEQKFLERTKAALEGRLPVNPGLLSSLEEQEATLREGLRSNLGSGFETSSPGIEALSDFRRQREEILEGARRGDLTLSESLGLSRQAGNLQLDQQRLATLLGPLGTSQGIVQNVGSGFAQNAAGFGAAQQPFQQQRQLQLEAAIQNSQRGSPFGALLGTVAGSFFGPVGGAVGSRFGDALFS